MPTSTEQVEEESGIGASRLLSVFLVNRGNNFMRGAAA